MNREPKNMSDGEIRAVFASEDHLRHAQGLHDQISWQADADGNINYTSGRLKSAHGIMSHELLGLDWIELIHPDDRTMTMNNYSHAIKTGNSMSFRNRLLDKHAGRYRWTQVIGHPRRDANGEIICWYGTTVDIDDTICLIDQQSTLLLELNHRVKNSLATVQSIVMQTFRSLRDRDEHNMESYKIFCDKVMERLLILSSAHDLLTQNSWSGTELHNLLEHTLLAVMHNTRFTTKGPRLSLNPNAALLLAMVFHELGTNAIKYGAWSNDTGNVSIDWEVVDDHVTITWCEIGGPLITEPDHLGFGTKLITKNGMKELGGSTEMNFDPKGLICYLRIALSEKVRHV